MNYMFFMNTGVLFSSIFDTFAYLGGDGEGGGSYKCLLTIIVKKEAAKRNNINVKA